MALAPRPAGRVGRRARRSGIGGNRRMSGRRHPWTGALVAAIIALALGVLLARAVRGRPAARTRRAGAGAAHRDRRERLQAKRDALLEHLERGRGEEGAAR